MGDGIEVRHRKGCRSTSGGRCDCQRTYRVTVWDGVRQRKVRHSFTNRGTAEAWRDRTRAGVRDGTVTIPTKRTLREAVADWITGAHAGTIRTRGRQPFKPSTIRAVEQNYRRRLDGRLGDLPLDRITTVDLQDFVDELDAAGVNASTVESTVLPLRLVYRRAKARGEVGIDPTDGVELPTKTSRGKRKPPAPADAAGLLAATPEAIRPVWATAMLAGLRRGELMALTWEDVDLDGGVLRVERSYDPTSDTFGTPKSRHGIRSVPIGRTLTATLREHLLRTGRRDGLVFGITAERPFNAKVVQGDADEAWKAAELERTTLHAARHLYASLSIAAGVNAHTLCRYMGHSSIKVTFDEYGHLFPGNEAEAAALLDAHLERTFVVASV